MGSLELRYYAFAAAILLCYTKLFEEDQNNSQEQSLIHHFPCHFMPVYGKLHCGGALCWSTGNFSVAEALTRMFKAESFLNLPKCAIFTDFYGDSYASIVSGFEKMGHFSLFFDFELVVLVGIIVDELFVAVAWPGCWDNIYHRYERHKNLTLL